MGMLIDIRKYNTENGISQIYESAKVKKSLFKKAKDNYWNYLNENTTSIDNELKTYIIADFFAFLAMKKNFSFALESESNDLSNIRGTGVILVTENDSNEIIQITEESGFETDLLNYAKELNGEFFDYTPEELKRNISAFNQSLKETNSRVNLIINIG